HTVIDLNGGATIGLQANCRIIRNDRIKDDNFSAARGGNAETAAIANARITDCHSGISVSSNVDSGSTLIPDSSIAHYQAGIIAGAHILNTPAGTAERAVDHAVFDIHFAVVRIGCARDTNGPCT